MSKIGAPATSRTKRFGSAAPAPSTYTPYASAWEKGFDDHLAKPFDPADAEVRGEMRNAIRIFDAMLDISGAEAAAGETPGPVPVDLGALAEEVAELYRPLAEDRGLRWSTDIAPGLRVLGDANLIAQALSNLLDNAVKFCRPGDAIAVTLH
ncbi:sensor histidine kinase [Oceaniglobus roseus]|uniref:sensor histidine kinase n=1 Tax=Oceaniglobus roseus TaxID=1737570 RepID=UPI001562A86C|nr:HAMP domain-containing sensor histidine kinase [Kandeliimicrobium roseum]